MITSETMTLLPSNPGSTRSITILRYGKPGGRPKAYLQAGLHADEAPSYIVLQHLCRKLAEADRTGQISGEVVVVPAANPIGLAQWRDDQLQGRFDCSNSINFNRNHLDLTEELARELEGRLGPDAATNIDMIRDALKQAIDRIRPEDEAQSLKRFLLSLSCDADIVLDLHCDLQAVLHVYLGTPHWPDWSDLPAQLGAEVTLLASDSGGTPFDEANSRPWWHLAACFPELPIPPACLAATVELRGICDTDRDVTSRDAENLFFFLQRRGCIAGQVPVLPELRRQATPLTGVDYLKAPGPGIIIFAKQPGDWVEKGDTVAEIINPLAELPAERFHPIRCATSGVLFARVADRHARTGRIIAKIAGRDPLRQAKGNLLTL